jgi:hypothetical protein
MLRSVRHGWHCDGRQPNGQRRRKLLQLIDYEAKRRQLCENAGAADSFVVGLRPAL